MGILAIPAIASALPLLVTTCEHKHSKHTHNITTALHGDENTCVARIRPSLPARRRPVCRGWLRRLARPTLGLHQRVVQGFGLPDHLLQKRKAHIPCKHDKPSCAYPNTASRLVASARLKPLPNLPDRSSHFFLTQDRIKYHRHTIRTPPSTHLASSSYNTPNRSDRPADFAEHAISTTTSLCTKAC